MFTEHLDANGLGVPVEVFPTSQGFAHGDRSLGAAFNPAVSLTEPGTLPAFAEGRFDALLDDGWVAEGLMRFVLPDALWFVTGGA